MRARRLVAAALAVGLGVLLGSCSSFSDFVSDRWPHFAGGEPGGVPPRPGTPGYAAFIAHGQPPEAANSNSPVSNGPAAATGSAAYVARTPPGNAPGVSPAPDAASSAAARQAPPAVAPPASADKSVQSGLY